MSAENEKLLGDIQETLKQYKEKIDKQIETLAKEQTDKANGEITTLKGELDNVRQSLEALKSAGKGFGLPGYGEKEAKEFSFQKFMLASYMQAAGGKGSCPVVDNPWDKFAPHEKEVCSAYMEQRGHDFMQQVEALTAMRFGSSIAQKAFEATDGSLGGFLIPKVVYQGPIVDVVYANTPILSMPGVLKIEGLLGDIPIPKDLSNLTAYMVGENSAPTQSTGSFGEVWLRPKKMGVFTKVSNRLVAYTNNAAEQIIRNKMTRDATVKISQQLTAGTGSEKQVLGLENNTSVMSAGTAIGSAGGRFTIDTALSMKQKLATVNELRDTPTYGYLMRPEALYGMQRERILQYSTQSAKNGMPVVSGKAFLSQAEIEGMLGAKIGHTTQLSATVTKSTSSTLSRVFFGDWSQFAWATFREPIFKVSDVAGDGSTGSAFLDDQLYMVMFWEFDAALLRGAAMCYIADAETLESNW